MTNQYTPIDISRLIHSKVPEVETTQQRWHISYFNGKQTDFVGSLTPSNKYNAYPAYRLDDVLRAIQVWGEKMGLPPVNDVPYAYLAHKILDAYLEDGLQFGPRSEEVIRSIFT